ncbi:hypothetical protein ABE142_24225 [Paenibacillus alvei]|uniref:hypothetical protein n=1 Tax=Paenibacillus alvei TaxID=44250 RepID=UPI003D2C8AFA
MKKWEWRHRDWCWVMFCIVLTFGASHANNIEVMELISYGSTFVSISLAFVAIYISVREATKADNLKDDLSMILGELKEKVGQVDNKLSLIDHDTLAGNMLKRPLEEFEKEVVKEMKSVSSLSPDEFDMIVEDKMHQLSKKLKDELVEEFEKVGQFTDNKLLKNMMYHKTGAGKTGWTLLQLDKNKDI